MSRNRRYRRGYSIGGVPEQVIAYFVPWCVVLAVWPLTVALHLAIGSSPLWMAFLAIGFAYLSHATWRTWSVRRKETRVMATVFVAAVLTWALFAVTISPWQADVVKAWALGGLPLCASWCLRHAAIAGVSDHDKSGEGNEDGLLSRIRAFKNARAKKVEESDDELRVGIDLEPGTTAKEAQDAREQIASVADVGADQVKVLKVKGHEGQVNVAFTRGADTSEPLVYKGPLHPGKSIADAPVTLGRRTDGSSIDWWIVGSPDPKKPRPLAHTKCTGVSGSGKTETICTAILRMRERVDVVPVVADPAKFEQSFGDIEEALGLAAKNKQQSVQLVANLVRLIEYRAGLFGTLTRADRKGTYKEWVPELWTEHGVPALFVDIEEATDIVFSVEEELDELLRKLRSVGVHLCASMQTMPGDNIPRKTRGAFTQSLAHGQNEDQDAKYALHPDTLDAGADPTKWRNDYPGSLYAELTGTDRSHWPIDGRVVCMTAEDKERSIDLTRKYWATMDEGTYHILARGIVNEQTTAVEADPEGSVDNDFDEVRDLSLVRDGIDISEPLSRPNEHVPTITWADSVDDSKVSTADARAQLMDRIRILRDSGQREVTFDAMEDLPQLVQRSRGWVYNEFERLTGEGVLRRLTPPGKRALYEIVDSVLIDAA